MNLPRARRAHPNRRPGLGLLLALALPAGAAAGETWPDRKCALYREAWSAALDLRGTAGIDAAFLDRHAAFLASGCTERAAICPRSPAELELANLLTLLAMNEGMASTFLPFACPN